MPKKLRIWPNGRVDIPDFARAANEYSSEVSSFSLDRLWLDRRSRAVEGFRVQIDDQTANPGQVTIYNGSAVNRAGNLFTEESLAASSVTVTLTGASTTFYLELELVESDSDTDSRAFMDPTFDNGGPPTPDGREVNLAVATRITPTWRIVRPVSTTGFQSTTNPNSLRVPLAVLSTNGSNEITSAVTSGLVTTQPSTTTEVDVLAGAGAVRCFDVRTFEVGDTITVGLGGAAPDTGLVISSIDAVNGILNFAPVLANNHNAGAIVRRTAGGSATVMTQNADPSRLTAHPDYLPRLFQGDETRGSALAASPDTFGENGDLSLRSMKDYVDYLSAQIRELKFGATRRDATEGVVPTTFDSPPRYFDPSGGVQGARSHTISIGDGTNSFGDFNGTDETPFIAALAALASFTPSTGKILVKNGTYTFANTVEITDRVHISGTTRDATIIVNNAASGAFSINAGVTDVVEISNLQLQAGTSAVHISIDGDGRNYIKTCAFVSGHITNGAGGDNRTYVTDCRFSGDFAVDGTDVYNYVFSECQFISVSAIVRGTTDITNITITDSVASCAYGVLGVNIEDVRIEHSAISSSIATIVATGDTSGLSIIGCEIDTAAAVIATATSTTHSQHKVSGNLINGSFGVGSEGSPATLFAYDGTCSYIAITDNQITATTSSAYCVLLYLSGTLNRLIMSNNSSNALTRVLHCVTSSSISHSIITSNTFTAPSVAITNPGFFRFDVGASSVASLKISNNHLVSANVTSGPNAIVFVDGAAPRELDVIGNFLSVGSVSSYASAILIGLSTAAAHTIKVSDNTIYSTGLTTPVSGIYLGLSGTTSTAQVTNNRIVSVVGSTGVYGIFVSGGVNSKIEGNVVETVQSTGAGPVCGIRVNNADTVTVNSNTVRTVTAVTPNSQDAALYLSEPVQTTVHSNILQVSTNIAKVLYASTSSATPYSSLSMNDNTIVGGTATTIHIGVNTGASAGWQGLSINANNIYMYSTVASYLTALSVVLQGGAVTDRSISISNNVIYERTYNEYSGVLYLYSNGSAVSGVSVSNNIARGLLVPAATGRQNNTVYIYNIGDIILNGNVIVWNSTSLGAEAGDVVLLDTCDRGMVVGNKINPGNGTTEIDVAGSTNMFVDSNYVGDGAAAGNINPAATAGTITIGTNKLT